MVKAMVPRPAPFGRGAALGDAATEAATRLGATEGEPDVVVLAAPQAVTAALAHSSSRTTSAIVEVPAAERRSVGCVTSMSPPRVVRWISPSILTARGARFFVVAVARRRPAGARARVPAACGSAQRRGKRRRTSTRVEGSSGGLDAIARTDGQGRTGAVVPIVIRSDVNACRAEARSPGEYSMRGARRLRAVPAAG